MHPKFDCNAHLDVRRGIAPETLSPEKLCNTSFHIVLHTVHCDAPRMELLSFSSTLANEKKTKRQHNGLNLQLWHPLSLYLDVGIHYLRRKRQWSYTCTTVNDRTNHLGRSCTQHNLLRKNPAPFSIPHNIVKLSILQDNRLGITWVSSR
jgi:hypothetical protein